jgi:hypothetical protein
LARKNTRPIFTVDIEDWYHALYPPEEWWDKECLIHEPTVWLVGQLMDHCVKAKFYVLEHVKIYQPELIEFIKEAGHEMASHGKYHQRGEWEEGDFRSPYWSTTPMPGFSGGFFFRVLPYQIFRYNLQRSGVFWIHPHDLLARHLHPKVKNKFHYFRRTVGLREIREKMKRLLRDVKWGDPSSG